MLDTVKINHVRHISFTQSRLTDAVSVILSELLSYEHPPKAGRFVFREISVLSQEAERADDRRLLCLSLADGEKADDADNEQDGIADAAGYRNKKGPEEYRADDAEQDVNDRKLERLTDMEACIR